MISIQEKEITEEKEPAPIYCCYCYPQNKLRQNKFFKNIYHCDRCEREYHITHQSSNQIIISITNTLR